MISSTLHIAGDESGSLTNPRNSIITAAILMTYKPLHLRWIIPRVKRKIPQKKAKYRPSAEFKFHNVTETARKKVLANLAKEDIKIAAFSIQKDDRKIPNTPENYSVLLCNLFKLCVGISPKNIDIAFDNYYTQFDKRTTLNEIIRNKLHLDMNIKFVDSQRNHMVQLADFIAGAINYSHRNEENDYYDLIRPLIVVDKITTWNEARREWLEWE